MERNHLVVLHGEVVALLALLVRDLHEEATDERLSDVREQLLLVAERVHVDVVPLHDALQLLPDAISLLKCTRGEVVVPCPVLVGGVWMAD